MNQKAGTVRMPIFSIFNHKSFASMVGVRVIMAYANAQTANPASIQIIALRPGARCMLLSKIATEMAVNAFRMRMMEKTIH